MIVRSPGIKVVNGHDGTLVCDADNKRVFKIHEVIGKFIDEVESSENESELTRRLEDFLLVQGGVAYNPFQIKAFVKRFVNDSVYVSKEKSLKVNDFDSHYNLPDTPAMAKIELLSRCNFSCPHCYVDATLERWNELPQDKVLSLIDELVELNVCEIQFTGGEPLLSKHLQTYVRYTVERGCRVKITTNGSLLTKSLMDFIDRYDVELQIGIYAVTPAMASRRKISERSYRNVLRNIAYLSGLRPHAVTLSQTLIDETDEEIEAFVNLAKEHGMKHLIARSIGAGRARTTGILPSIRRIEQERVKICGSDAKKADGNGNVVFKDRPCSFNSIDILSNGDVTNCILMRSGAAVVGNIFQDSVKTIWFGEKNQNVRNTHVDTIPVCKDCEQRYLCGGGCMAAGFNENGSLCNPYPSCALKQDLVSKYWRDQGQC